MGGRVAAWSWVVREVLVKGEGEGRSAGSERMHPVAC